MSSEDSEQQVRDSEVGRNPPKRLRTAETPTGGTETEAKNSTVDVVGDDLHKINTDIKKS